MAAPYIHAISSSKKYGGKPEDYIDIHELMDSSKNCVADNRHRVLTHNSWFVVTILPLVFGHQRTNSDGKKYNVKDIGEQHCLEDFRHKYIPTPQDYVMSMKLEPWMNNGIGLCPSAANLYSKPEIPTQIITEIKQSQESEIPIKYFD